MSDEQRDGDRVSDPEDNRLDAVLRAAAQDYNPPPPTPRDAMWSRIEARRRAGTRELRERVGGTGARGPDSVVSRAEPTVIPLRPRARRQWLRWGVGIAAALALGFGLGRWEGTPERGAHGTRVANVPESPRAATAPSPSSESAAVRRDVAAVPSAEATASPPASPRERTEGGTGLATVAQSGRGREQSPVAGPGSQVPEAAYTLAAIQHLTQAEALLTSFRAEARGGKEMDAQLSAWARDLLGSTRLMLDSPAGRDPRMRRLLEDLELVLAQIAQLGAQRAGDERNLIDEAVEGRNVLPRLRTTIPAGVRPVGS